jgi:hypothetical protein
MCWVSRKATKKVSRIYWVVMPDLIRYPDVVPTKVGNYHEDWIPVLTGNPGFRLEFTPYLIRGRNDTFL